MKTLMVGAGAVGGYVGGRLARAGRDVDFLVRPGRAAQLAERGLCIVDGVNADVADVRALTRRTCPGPYDLVLVGVKAQALPRPGPAELTRLHGLSSPLPPRPSGADLDRVQVMHGNRQSIDVVVHSEDEVSLNLAATRIEANRLQLVGSLTDPQVQARVDVSISTALSAGLVEGAHVNRQTTWQLEVNGEETEVSWEVVTKQLDNLYRLHDVRARGDSVSIRAFGIEDLAATVGVGLAAGIAAFYAWRSLRRDKLAKEILEQQMRDCRERGGFPTIEFDLSDEAKLDIHGPKIKANYKYNVRCNPAPPGS